MDETSVCPLVTPYTKKKGISVELLEKLFLLRTWPFEFNDRGEVTNPIPFKRPSFLRETIWDVFNERDTGQPLIVRQYQIQAIHHLARMPKFFFFLVTQWDLEKRL